MSDYRPIYDASYALIIGIDTYADARFVPLGQAEADAQSLTALLSGPPYDFRVTQLLGRQASRQTILDALFGLRRVEADDRLLIYFAGHGYTLIDRLGNETGYLAAADTVPEKDYTALALDEVIALTRHSLAKHIAFVFDACYSGQALGLTRAPAASTDKLLVRRAYQVMSAGAGDQTVSDYRSMTGVLIQALRSGVMNQDGLVTFSEIGLYLQQTITSESRMTQIPQFGHLRGSQGGEFVFYEDRSVRLPRDVVAMLASERAVARQGAVVALIEIARGDDPGLAILAREHLARLSSEDPDARVRATAARYLQDTQDRQIEVDIRPAERVRPQPAAPPPQVAPAYAPAYEESLPVPVAARKKVSKSTRRRSGSRLIGFLLIGGAICLALVVALIGVNVLFGQFTASNDAARTQTAAAAEATQTAAHQTTPTPKVTEPAAPTLAPTATQFLSVPTFAPPTNPPPPPPTEPPAVAPTAVTTDLPHTPPPASTVTP